jgi:hypothetical protein
MGLKLTNKIGPTASLKENSQGRNEYCDKNLGKGMSIA